MPDHLSKAVDLITTTEKTRAGFVALAHERNRRATPLVAEGRALKAAASKAKDPWDLLNITDIRNSLLTAAGVSDKAANHLLDADKNDAIKLLIKDFLEPAGPNFLEELVFRYLLTRGDTLGGSMRNVAGALGQSKLTRAILSYFTVSKTPYYWMHQQTKQWAKSTSNDTDIDRSVRGLSWINGEKKRTLMYNLTVPFIGKNVDLCLINATHMTVSTKYNDPQSYIALGELKGGIDPAGADEHWKTANSALTRIRNKFDAKKLKPELFFVGAAIEKDMASEIWQHLQNGTLGNAANLTDADQVASLCTWLCRL